MSLPTGILGPAEFAVGVVPAWALVFRDATTDRQLRLISSDSYVGSVSATLASGLAGGSYEIVVEGLTPEDYQEIRRPPLTADLHLWWQDAPGGRRGGLARFTGLNSSLSATTPDPPEDSLVARLRVERLWRRPGQRRIEVVVDAVELVVGRLAEHFVAGRCFATLQRAVDVVTAGVVPVVGYGLAAAEPVAGQADFATTPPGNALTAMTVLTRQLQSALRLAGQPVAMIRDGRLHLGKWTTSAQRTGLDRIRSLADDSGLLNIERGAAVPRDSRVPPVLTGGPAPPRQSVAVTALGRPDLKPGDTVRLVLPPEDFAAGDPATCRIVEVSHQVSREKGFLTRFRAVLLTGADDGWDSIPARADGENTTPRQPAVPFADSAHGAASTVGGVITDLVSRAVGEVRSRPAMIHDHAVSQDSPRHSSDVWYATTVADGHPGAAQRAPITADAHAEVAQVPYLTPFAWGGFGLVLPRYPGTRVVLANVGGGPGDFVDVGALWPRNGGPAAKPGDYWLALPVAVPDREHLRDPDRPLPDDGPATHDLIDADGTRVIETARFVLRVTDRLTRVPDRPAPDDDLGDGTVLIETRSGDGTPARITLSADGAVTISARSITFDAEDQIALNAKDVRVTVDGTMDVS
ncbi:hypothetical protein [Actinophytocola sp.]|uniref:hypothetical protein n=1 Tax=Actinophytocola sp. TaxID=1872138 RepID=UPI002D7EE5F5|nr:hypothetical protein [Actinophytocola sp.]HET9141624.1 hypothetical protein [Actinophytocola sp.]